MILKFLIKLCCCMRVKKTKTKENNIYKQYTDSSDPIWKAFESSTY